MIRYLLFRRHINFVEERGKRGEEKKKKDHAPPTFTSTTSLVRAP